MKFKNLKKYKLHPELKILLNEEENLNKKLTLVNNQIQELVLKVLMDHIKQFPYLKELKEGFERQGLSLPSDEFILGYNDCNKSPLGKCICRYYNSICLFCYDGLDSYEKKDKY